MCLLPALLLTLVLSWGSYASAVGSAAARPGKTSSDISGHSKVSHNASDIVRKLRSPSEQDGVWSPRLLRADSKEIVEPPFWANRGRRELNELLDSYFNSHTRGDGTLEVKPSLENMQPTSVNHGRENGVKTFDDLRSAMGYRNRDESQPMALLLSLWRNRLRNEDSNGIMKYKDNRSQREEPLAEDESRFWANRGRREEEEDRFWANRGRSVEEKDPFWANRGRNVEGQEPFWANRGRSVDADGPFYANRGRAVNEEQPFYANRGRAASEESNPSRGSEINEEELLYANRGRETNEEEPFYANRGRAANEEGPFWANRGRDVRDKTPAPSKRSATSVEHAPYASSRAVGVVGRDRMTGNDLLYVEEPSWIALDRRQVMGGSGGIGHESEPFWISRGRRGEQDQRHQRGLKNSLSVEEPFYPTRGRRGLKDSLSTEEPFWAVRGRRRLLESLSQEDPFWAVRGKKSYPPLEMWQHGKRGGPSSATRALGGLQDPNFWPVRGKRDHEPENEEDDKFWDAMETKSAAKTHTTDKYSMTNNPALK